MGEKDGGETIWIVVFVGFVFSVLRMPEDSFIPPHGGYEKLLSYQKALIVFDGTVFFVKKWLPKYGDRTVDQMVQAARSGK